MNGRVAKLCFRTCAACPPHSQAGFCLCTSSAISIGGKPTLIDSSVTLLEESAPPKLPTRHGPLPFFPSGLDTSTKKAGVPLSAPVQPESDFQRLPATLCNHAQASMPSYSKAPGVFPSCCQYAASSRQLYFHRALR